MTDRTGSTIAVTASMSDKDLLTYLVAISSGITPAGLMEAVGRLPKSKDTLKLGALAVGSSMNIRKVINDVRSKAGINLPDEWLINGEINFSMLAMLGHIFFIGDESDLTPAGVAAKAAYIKSIGGVANISMYTSASKIEGKEMRSTILLKWAGTLRSFNFSKHQNSLSSKFPNVVKDKRGVLGWVYDSFMSIILAPFRYVMQTIRAIWDFIYAILSRVIWVIAIYVACYSFFMTIGPNTGNALAEIVGAAPFPSGPTSIGAVGYGAISSLMQVPVRSVPLFYATMTKVPGAATEGYEFLVNTSPKLVALALSVPSREEGAYEAAYKDLAPGEIANKGFATLISTADYVVGGMIEAVTGEDPPPISSVFTGASLDKLTSSLVMDYRALLSTITGRFPTLKTSPEVKEATGASGEYLEDEFDLDEFLDEQEF